MSVGQRIKQRRLELKLSADQLADLIGKNRATVYRYESDEIDNMPLSVLEPLAKALKVKPSYLLGWDEELDNIAAHHEGEDWTEEELEEIEEFKQFVLSKRKEHPKKGE